MERNAYEINFDGLAGPTHNYGGLSLGNIPSMKNKNAESSPKAAALQGLEKMRLLSSLGIKQGVLPPHERPHIPTLKTLGFQGSDGEILSSASEKAPEIFAACCSATSMWTANAATVIPSQDCYDKHVHFIPANLNKMFHRSIECETTALVLKTIFQNPVFFTHHSPLPAQEAFSDEGAANQNRFCREYEGPGIYLFVYGRTHFRASSLSPSLYPARQTMEASQALARLSTLYPERVLFAQQNPRAIDAGMFHNDVASVGNENVFLYHEAAFVAETQIIEQINAKMEKISDTPMVFIKVEENRLSLKNAVASYFFNSQIVTREDRHMTLIAPEECRHVEAVQSILQNILSSNENPINDLRYLDLRESMQNGGGPACLRLRVVLTAQELKEMKQEVLFTDRLYDKLKDWINRHYRDRLEAKDLSDPLLLKEGYVALDELTKILNLGSIYSFQK